MRVLFHKDFKKQYAKLSKKLQEHTDERIMLFLIHPSAAQLKNHPLQGKYNGYSSINITGDYRALYKLIESGIAVFTYIDTHDKLYR